MKFFRTVEFKVGAMVVGIGILIAAMSMTVNDDPSFMKKTTGAWFLLPNAGGLIKKSAVRSAGIPVGIISNIKLQDGKARVEISVSSDINLTTSAAIEIRAQGILGDSHVEIYPGSPTDPPLPDGGQILNIKDGGSLDKLVGEVTEVTGSLKQVAQALKEAVSEDGTRKHVLGRIVGNIETLTNDLAQITSQNKNKIGNIVDEVHGISKTLNGLINDQGENGFKRQWAKAMSAMGRLDSALKNIDEISQKINKGEGTIGKLVNDESTVEDLNTAISGVSGMVDIAARTQTAFDFNAYYMNEIKATRSILGIQIQPGNDRFYYIGLVDDPTGVRNLTSTRVMNSDGSIRDDVREQKTYFNQLKFTILFAKNFYDLTVKGGMIENTGGFGLDYSFFRKRFIASLEAFSFGSVNLRASLQYKIYSGIYVIGGMHDILDKNGQRSAYLGAGLFLTNDDLKLLLTRAPF